MVLAVLLALQPGLTLWRLIELKMELLIQCVPAFLVALHWSGLRAQGVLAGLCLGTGIAVIATLSGYAQWYGIHIGVVAALINAATACLISLWINRMDRKEP